MSLNNISEEMSDDSGRRGADKTSPTSSVAQTMQARKQNRRSSMFRRDVLSSQDPGSDNSLSSSPFKYQDSDVKTSGLSSNHSQDNKDEPKISMSDYEKALETEKEEWSLTRRSRSDKYHHLNAQLKSQKFDAITFESCAHLLSSEDKKFMSERPNYVEIANNVRQLKEEVLIAMGAKQNKLLEAKEAVSTFNKALEVVDWQAANLD